MWKKLLFVFRDKCRIFCILYKWTKTSSLIRLGSKKDYQRVNQRGEVFVWCQYDNSTKNKRKCFLLWPSIRE
jgi:hypothetical protein